MSRTKILSVRTQDKILLAYANTARNLSGLPNCMLLPVPGTLTRSDFFDTTPYAGFLDELQEMWSPRARSLGGQSKGVSMMGHLRSVERFTVGMYEMFVVSPGDGKPWYEGEGRAHPLDIALQALPPAQRPAVSDALLRYYDANYPGWSLVACVFGGDKAMDAQPVMFTYRPTVARCLTELFFPALDGHDGGLPIEGQVPVDHFLFAGSDDGMLIPFRANQVPDVVQVPLEGMPQTGSRQNGDWWWQGVDRCFARCTRRGLL